MDKWTYEKAWKCLREYLESDPPMLNRSMKIDRNATVLLMKVFEGVITREELKPNE